VAKWALIINEAVDTVSFEDQSGQEGWIKVPDSVLAGFEKEGEQWRPPEAAPDPGPESVTARQFKLQLLALGILDEVDAWVSLQGREIQIAYEYSGMFVRSEPMMYQGFQALDFTDHQIDDFFLAASKR
jgi:hypothetical protein